MVQAAAAGDAVASQILAGAAADLGAQAAAVARRLDLRGGEYALRVAGGVLCHAPPVRDRLVQWLTTAGLQPAEVVVVSDLAAAAARMAAAGGS